MGYTDNEFSKELQTIAESKKHPLFSLYIPPPYDLHTRVEEDFTVDYTVDYRDAQALGSCS